MSTSYLLRTKPQGERKSVNGLKRCGHVAWHPTEERVARRSGRTKRKRIVIYPLAPRYVVVEMPDPFEAVREIDEVTDVVRVTGQTALRERDVARLRAMDGSNAETVLHKALAVGQAIVVRDGPFRNFQAIINLIDGADATINVDVFGRPTPVTMPLAYLDPV